jgi:hypothetical protein
MVLSFHLFTSFPYYLGKLMAKPNYSFEKRQRDLAKKQKKEEKRLRKQGPGDTPEAADRTETAEPDAEPSTELPTEPPAA